MDEGAEIQEASQPVREQPLGGVTLNKEEVGGVLTEALTFDLDMNSQSAAAAAVGTPPVSICYVHGAFFEIFLWTEQSCFVFVQ